MFGDRVLTIRLLAAGLLAACAVPLIAQQQPTFRAAAQTVSIYATVTDPAGRLVPDLTQDDFEVFDDSQPQPITVFENGVQPITVAIMRDMSGSMLPARNLTDAAMKQFIASLIEGDRACYGVFAGSVAWSIGSSRAITINCCRRSRCPCRRFAMARRSGTPCPSRCNRSTISRAVA